MTAMYFIRITVIVIPLKYTTSYTYDVNGVRIGKSGAKNVSYVVSGTQILSETNGTTTTYYIYDDKGLPIGLVYNGTTYTYRKNLQGDVIAILDGSGTEVVTYVYNAWGAHKTYGTLKDTLGKANPFRYRGYYYDTESTYYYLNSRYYDPITGRFLNADGFVSTGQGVLGTNMFAYCGNNPVMRVDPSGLWWDDIWSGIQSGFDTFCSYHQTGWNVMVGAAKRELTKTQNNIKEVITLDINNESEQKVVESNFVSGYKGTLVVRTPFDSSFSFGFIGLSGNASTETVKHEYGHTRQFNSMGPVSYLFNVAIPSVTINILDDQEKLPYDYYTYPFEAEANKLGESTLTQGRIPLPPGAYNSYWDLIPLFFAE